MRVPRSMPLATDTRVAAPADRLIWAVLGTIALGVLVTARMLAPDPSGMGTHEQLEPYGHLNDNYQADNWFAEYYCRITEMLFGRFEDGLMAHFKHRRNGGIGAFTPDNVPVFDWIADNAFMTADSNHGFKMIGVGKLVARLLSTGDLPSELAPFSARRFEEGWTYGDRNSNCPWV